MSAIDFTSEVTVLSTKLIEAIDRQAELEDQVHVLRKELESTRQSKRVIDDKISSGQLVDGEKVQNRI